MSNINIKKIYKDIKQFQGEAKAKEFIYNMSNGLQSFHTRLKNIMDALIIKYHHRLSNSTLEKLKEITALCDVSKNIIFPKTTPKSEPSSFVEMENFASKLSEKLDEVYYDNDKYLQQETQPEKEEEISDDDLWIPNELVNVSNAINEKAKELNLSFLDGIKASNLTKNNNKENVLEIINKEDDDIFLLNGKEISDEEFMNALKAKV